MNVEIKFFIEENYDYLVKLYNRYVKFCLIGSSEIEYYASPYMNLLGFPSESFLNFSKLIYTRRKKKKYCQKQSKIRTLVKFFLYLKLLFLYLFGFLFFSKTLKSKSTVIHGFHVNSNFKFTPYRTNKTPPLEYLDGEEVYHDINLSFVDLKGLLKYRKNKIIISLRFLRFYDLCKLHLIAYKVYFRNRKIKAFKIDYSYIDILYTLVKGVATAKLINSLDKKSLYLHMWENRGHQLISDYLVKDENKLVFLDLGITFRLASNYTMFNYQVHNFNSQILFMSKYNVDLVKSNFKALNYSLFRNYRIECEEQIINNNNDNKVLVVAPLSYEVSNHLYALILKNDSKNIKMKLHPYINSQPYIKEYLETNNINEIFNEYDIIIYAGATTAALEFYFKGKSVFKFEFDKFIDIDPLTDLKLVKRIKNIEEVFTKKSDIDKDIKEYMIGCENKTFEEVIKEIRA